MRISTIFFSFLLLFVAACGSSTDSSSDGLGQGTGPATSGPTPGTQEHLNQQVSDRVFFDLDSSAIRPDARATLDNLATWMRSYPSASILIEGHCDERGTREYNLGLGDRRANAVRNYLIASGIDANRLRTVSYGKERAAALGSNEAAWAQNRRGVFVVQ